jgi:sortase A
MKFKDRGPSSVRTFGLVRLSRWLLFLAGIVSLAYVGFALLEARLYQDSESRRFQLEVNKLRPSSGTLPLPLVEVKPTWVDSLGLSDGGSHPLGRIQIGAIGLSAMVLEGIDGRTLRRGVGHIPGTPLPGQLGNVALAGHRDTFFRALRNISEGDEINMETLSGFYRYRVDSTKVVDAGEMQVLDKSDDAILTLVTCYPFSFVGPAPKRFVVRAHKLARTAGEPTSAGSLAQ